jgi:hypothetical protein
MPRVIIGLAAMALLVFCLIDAVQTKPEYVRNMPKWAWVLLILVLPIVGPLAWLVAGRPRHRPNAVPWPSKTAGYPEYERPRQTPRAPDDDPEFLASLKRDNAAHEDLLKKWEEDLKRREDELRKPDETPTDPA